jgi:hypothetical protein
MMRRSGLLVGVMVVALVMAACAQDSNTEPDPAGVGSTIVEDPALDPEPSDGGDVASSGFAVDGGLTIPEAIRYQGDQVVAVQGFIIRDEQSDALCESLAESYPPQCGGASLTIVNSEVIDDMALIEAGEVQWSETYVTIFGYISDGNLTIDPTVNG